MMLNKELVYLGGGCFWCIESIFNQVNGVEEVISGYMGGTKIKANYKDVCTGRTGHAEVVKVIFDNKVISFSKILEIFFYVHDPTSLNRQGNDIGSQYRSIIFFSSEDQLKVIENEISKINFKLNNKIVTEVKRFMEFYEAEDYHVDYYNLNKNQPYCSLVISPKISSFQEKFKKLLKD
ncbi:MAG: peptide-methionine (S)-S-oxide reductase [Flavobacteriaceae bacterium]|nr:peptide-methionine (S)-S-oxide reductase [Flavobacteriaceae bacterium]